MLFCVVIGFPFEHDFPEGEEFLPETSCVDFLWKCFILCDRDDLESMAKVISVLLFCGFLHCYCSESFQAVT